MNLYLQIMIKLPVLKIQFISIYINTSIVFIVVKWWTKCLKVWTSVNWWKLFKSLQVDHFTILFSWPFQTWRKLLTLNSHQAACFSNEFCVASPHHFKSYFYLIKWFCLVKTKIRVHNYGQSFLLVGEIWNFRLVLLKSKISPTWKEIWNLKR